MEYFPKAYGGLRVLVTGHTGFKGSWLCEWLISLDAEVWGFSLAPATRPALFTQLGLQSRVNDLRGDLREAAAVAKAVRSANPHFVFHLAAQPIVRTANVSPADTWSTNVMGTVNLLEALRSVKHPCAAVLVTTDKVYGASPGTHSERNAIGANDPYGASKSAAELASDAWRRTYFPIKGGGRTRLPLVALATARSGNVIGGGDWGMDRLLPDCVRALSRGEPITLRNPSSIRPWQHVLDPLAGYLKLGARLRGALVSGSVRRLAELSGPFNFGPAEGGHRPVREVVREVLGHWPGKWRRAPSGDGPAETPVLRLNSGKARRVLEWRPKWGFARTIDQTVRWYRAATSPQAAQEMTRRQLAEYSGD